VKVQSNGAPKAGVTVRWQTSDGSLTQDSSLTNAAGVASMHWTLGTESKVMNVTASVADAYGSPVTFRANAVPGPAFAVSRIPGDGSTLAVNQRIRLIAQVTDRYSNRVEGQTVIWQVQSGPVAFATIGGATDPSGESVAIVVPSGTQGAAVVRATLPGSTASVDFNLTITPRSWDVTLSTSPLQFISRQNGSSHPAVDTIPAGETMRWTLTTYNYDEHSLVSVGNPSFVGGDFPYAARSSVSVTFTTPGTYQYTDFFYPGATGFVVVQ
jgi:plastocyanin